MGAALEGIKNIFITVVFSVLLIILAIIYFGLALWIIKLATNFFFGSGLEANWAVFAAAILSAASILAGSLEKKPSRK